jgi:hypothetical protein
MEFVSALIVCYIHWTVTCDKNVGVLCTLDGIARLIELEVSKKSYTINLMQIISLC